jgi:antitoxin YefM
MQTLSYTAFRNQLAKILDQVNDDHAPVLITRQNGKPAVVVSLEEFQSYEETAYLMASPKNRQRLDEAVAQINSGQSTPHELIKE